jgi:hypothetical protein
MSDSEDLEKSGLLEAFNLQANEVLEAKSNLLGFFNALYKIDKRLKEKARQRKGEGAYD